MRTAISPLCLVALLSLPLGACSGPADPSFSETAVHLAPRARAPHVGSTNDAGRALVPQATAQKAASPAPARAIDLDPDGAIVERDPKDATEFFVWTREAEERTVTYRLDASGRVLEELDGIVVATGVGMWQWQREDRSIPTTPCEHYDDEGHVFVGSPVEPGTAARASLMHMTSGAEQIIVDPGVDLMGNAEVEHDVEVVASIGPYLFIEESTYAYTCGAHGNTGVATMIWNAATGTVVAMPTDLGPLEAARQTAVAALTDEDDDAFAPTEENLELTEFLPKFAPDGALVLGLQMTAPTCYACTRGGFGSYTKSTVVDAPSLPALFGAFVSAPPAVRTFLGTRPEVEMKGWSAR